MSHLPLGHHEIPVARLASEVVDLFQRRATEPTAMATTLSRFAQLTDQLDRTI